MLFLALKEPVEWLKPIAASSFNGLLSCVRREDVRAIVLDASNDLQDVERVVDELYGDILLLGKRRGERLTVLERDGVVATDLAGEVAVVESPRLRGVAFQLLQRQVQTGV